MEEALQIQRETEIIALTGWTFDEYDDQPAGRVARMMTYVSLKNGIEREASERRGKGGGLTGGGR